MNDHVIVDALEVMDHVMAQVNEVLHPNQNQNDEADELCGLGKF